jgi:hypothetical protein
VGDVERVIERPKAEVTIASIQEVEVEKRETPQSNE